MEVEFTARKVKISKALRAKAEEGLQRIAQVMGKTAHASIIFSEQRLAQIVELTVQARSQKFVATGKAATQLTALREAIEHLEHQALRHRDKQLERKRLPKEEKEAVALPATRGKTRTSAPKKATVAVKAPRASSKTRNAIAVHSAPTRTTVVEPHVVKGGDSFSLKPMTIEEAVKDAEFRDLDLLIFHNPAGELFVLHRRRDGEMELVEIS